MPGAKKITQQGSPRSAPKRTPAQDSALAKKIDARPKKSDKESVNDNIKSAYLKGDSTTRANIEKKLKNRRNY